MPHPISRPVSTNRPLADFVVDDARTAQVLEDFGLDYCCGGQRTLEEAAAARALDLAAIVEALEALGPARASDALPAEWKDLDVLTRHIVSVHHRYVREALPQIAAWLEKLVTRHGDRHGELREVQAIFRGLADELTAHMGKEENILFPFIEELAAAARGGTGLPGSPFGTVMHPVRVMEDDHRLAGELVDRLRTLTGGYHPPEDGCTTYRACYAALEKFETDLHRHIHLENNVLFPRALELEQRLV